MSEPSKRQRLEAKAVRRQELIDATIECIHKHGLSGTTMQRISDIAGSSVGLVNFHFATKTALYEAVLIYLSSEERRQWMKFISLPDLTPSERILNIIDARFNSLVCEQKNLSVWCAFWGDAGTRALYRKVVEQQDDERLAVEEEIFENLIKETGLHYNAENLAIGMECFCDGLWLNMMVYPEYINRMFSRQRLLEHLNALFPKHFAIPEIVEQRDWPVLIPRK